MKPLAEAAAQVEAIMKAAAEEGVPDFVLNARTDAFHLGRDRDPEENLAEAIERGQGVPRRGRAGRVRARAARRGPDRRRSSTRSARSG